MPDEPIIVDTNSAAYLNRLQGLNNLIDELRPHVAALARLAAADPAEARQLLDDHPLLKRWCQASIRTARVLPEVA